MDAEPALDGNDIRCDGRLSISFEEGLFMRTDHVRPTGIRNDFKIRTGVKG